MQSRYYDPQVGRFISPDDTDYLGATWNVLGYNIYCYCENNVVNIDVSTGFAQKNSEIPPKSSGYIPPNGKPQKGKTKGEKSGWKDSQGNIWIPDPSNHGGDHWDVISPDTIVLNYLTNAIPLTNDFFDRCIQFFDINDDCYKFARMILEDNLKSNKEIVLKYHRYIPKSCYICNFYGCKIHSNSYEIY